MSNACSISERRELLLADVDTNDIAADHERDRQRQRLHRRIADAVRKQDNLLHQGENADPDAPVTQGPWQRYDDLENERRAVNGTLEQLEKEMPARDHPTTEQASLLDALPHLATNLRHAPPELLQRLLDLTQLTVQVHYRDNQATITAVLPSDIAPIAATGREIAEQAIDHDPDYQVSAGQELCASCECPPGRLRRDAQRD
ncbi:hypothetical protein L6E12_23615 [Actinokineospora sp. PR83]|uniref:hypothetical protein n=1 Tax=Actinokineospora sp. PR83 TaxID=2884908 RepID=UPI001F38C246|nr:hypothetical protein [Actinokineospora sp. PR83]MCG8918773.1 hypothetical protein [Actinokineospora sp. PR83]